MFKDYESKPIVRSAHQITYDGRHTRYGESNEWKVVIGDKWHNFKAHSDVKVGDWVVHLSDTDIYHCTDEVFRERNVVP